MVGKWQPPALAGGRGDAGGFEAWTLWGEVSRPRVVHNNRCPTFIDLTNFADLVARLDFLPPASGATGCPTHGLLVGLRPERSGRGRDQKPAGQSFGSCQITSTEQGDFVMNWFVMSSSSTSIQRLRAGIVWAPTTSKS